MEQRCIYCGKAEDLSESDIIPDALTNARILNKNVCRIEHNNKFSDMFESEVIKALSFITNELDIKSSKGKKYAAYDATLTIDGSEYDISLHGDNNIFDGRVLKSSDKTQMISSYKKIVKISGDESKVHPVDVNHLEIEKKVRINCEIFYSQSMYRMISKIAFEWYCAKNSVIGYHQEFDNIISFITTGNGDNPVSIIQETELYTMLTDQMNLGSHALFAFESSNGEINVVISLFGLLMYRVVVSKSRPEFCSKNFLFSELRTDSSRREIEHESIKAAEECFSEVFNPEKFQPPVEIYGKKFMIPKKFEPEIDVLLYTFVFNMVKCFDGIRSDATAPNENLNNIFLKQLETITQASTLQKKSIKRFVNETFSEGHSPIQLNPYTHNKKATVLFYAVYLVGLSDIDKLDDNTFQHLLRERLPFYNGEELVVTDEIEQQLKTQIMETDNYSDILEKGAHIIKQWNN